MARFTEPTAAQEAGWKDWVASRPERVRQIAERFEPWSLYRLKTTGQRVTLRSFSEDGTVSVNVSGDDNLLLFERYVFGIDPDDLEPCALPSPDEPVGALLTDAQVADNIDVLRVMGRPDLWAMGPDGKATRKN